MQLPSFSLLMKFVMSLLPEPVQPLVLATAKPVTTRPILDCTFFEIIAAATTAPMQGRQAEATLPSAAGVDEPAERPIVASIASHVALTAVTAPRREPEDFLLARRLEVTAKLNRPKSNKPVVVVGAAANRGDSAARIKKIRPGCLSPVLARGTRPAFSTPVALAA